MNLIRLIQNALGKKPEIRLEYVNIQPGVVQVRRYDVNTGEQYGSINALTFSREVMEEIQRLRK